jgi:hypothetical protein
MNNLDLIKQYINATGQQIGEYQFSKLSDNLKNSYLRKRMQAIGLDLNVNNFTNGLRGYEFIKLSNESQLSVVKKLNGPAFGVLLDDKHKLAVLDILFHNEEFFKKLNDVNIIYNVINALKNTGKESYFLEKLFNNEFFINQVDLKEQVFIQILKSVSDPNMALILLEKNASPKMKTKIFYFIRNLPDSMILHLFRNSSNQKELFNLLGEEKSKHFFNKISPANFLKLIEFSKNPEQLFYLAKISNFEMLDIVIAYLRQVDILKSKGMADKIPYNLTKNYEPYF